MNFSEFSPFIRFLSVLFLFMTSGCSSLLYYPSKQSHIQPMALDLAPEEKWISLTPLSSEAGDARQSPEQLHAWYFHSPNPKALVVFFHGNAENLTSHFVSLSFLPPLGYDYIIFDYRGFGKSSVPKSGLGPESTVQDGVAILRWADHLRQTSTSTQNEPLPLVVFGQSLGGAVLIRALQEWEESANRVALAVFDSTFSSYQSVGRSILASTFLTWPLQFLPYVLFSDEWAPKKEKATVDLPGKYPVLVLHGSADQTVDYRLGRELFHQLRPPKAFWHIEGGRHSDAFWANDGIHRRRFIELLDSFFARTPERRAPEKNWALPPGVRPDLSYIYALPYEEGKSFEVLQARHGRFSHQGVSEFAIDFAMPEGTQVRAVRAGEVVRVEQGFKEGGPAESFRSKVNLVLIRHDDGTLAEYAHLKQNSARVQVGERVCAGCWIAESGNTGFSSEPHLHLMVFVPQPGFPHLPLHSVPLVFDTREEPAFEVKTGMNPEAVAIDHYQKKFLRSH